MQCIEKEMLPVVHSSFTELVLWAPTKVMNLFGALLKDEFDNMAGKAEDVLKDIPKKG